MKNGLHAGRVTEVSKKFLKDDRTPGGIVKLIMLNNKKN